MTHYILVYRQPIFLKVKARKTRTLARLLPFRHDGAIPELHRGKHRLIVAHHDSRGGLLKHLDNISDADIATITIRTTEPMLYELNEHIVPVGP